MGQADISAQYVKWNTDVLCTWHDNQQKLESQTFDLKGHSHRWLCPKDLLWVI